MRRGFRRGTHQRRVLSTDGRNLPVHNAEVKITTLGGGLPDLFTTHASPNRIPNPMYTDQRGRFPFWCDIDERVAYLDLLAFITRPGEETEVLGIRLIPDEDAQ